MNTIPENKFRVLVVGDVTSQDQPSGARRAWRPASLARIEDIPQFGGAANIARIAAGLGNTVGFLLLGKADIAMRLRQISHFHALLPRYEVIVFSEYRHCALEDINGMIAAARQSGKRVLVDLDENETGIPTGASLLTADLGTLRRLIGVWRSKHELAVKIDMLLSGFQCEGCLANCADSGIFLYLPGGAIQFANMIGCNRHYLLAAVAATLKTGISLTKGVCTASDRFDLTVAVPRSEVVRQGVMRS